MKLGAGAGIRTLDLNIGKVEDRIHCGSRYFTSAFEACDREKNLRLSK